LTLSFDVAFAATSSVHQVVVHVDVLQYPTVAELASRFTIVIPTSFSVVSLTPHPAATSATAATITPRLIAPTWSAFLTAGR
jgi:hypothetical protein